MRKKNLFFILRREAFSLLDWFKSITRYKFSITKLTKMIPVIISWPFTSKVQQDAGSSVDLYL